MKDNANRLQKIREMLNESDLEAVLVTSRPNFIYLSGFDGSAACLFVSDSEAVLIVDFRYTLQAQKQIFSGINVIEYKDSVFNEVRTLLGKRNKIGFEGTKLSYNKYKEMRKKLPNCTFIDVEDKINALRSVKDDIEISFIKRAVEITDKTFKEVLDLIKPGVLEMDISAEIEYKMKKLGASISSFNTVVASGARSALPHGTASLKKIEKGDAVVLDFGCVYENYCSDMTRTVFVGRPHEKLKEIYNIVLKAQNIGIENTQAGACGRDVDKEAREYIRSRGYGAYFGHSLGHGVGLEVHEQPRLSTKSETTLRSNMVVTVEPGIYLPEIGGIRIEDMVVVTAGYPEILTSSTKEMIVL